MLAGPGTAGRADTLARVSPRNAASTFGASIEQALQGVEVRVKRLEEQPGHGPLEEAVRSAEARLQRLERDRDGQAKLYERVESLVASRTAELRQNINRSLEVIVDKVKDEVESVRSELAGRDAQLLEFQQELDGLLDLRKYIDDFSDVEARFQAEAKATKDVCMAATLQVGVLEDSLAHLRSSVSELPPFLWSLGLGEPPYRRVDPGAHPGHSRHGLLLQTSAAAATERAPLGARGAAARSAGSAGSAPVSPKWREGEGRRKADRALSAASLVAADALMMDSRADQLWAAGAAGTRSTRSSSRGNASSAARLAGEALMDAGQDA